MPWNLQWQKHVAWKRNRFRYWLRRRERRARELADFFGAAWPAFAVAALLCVVLVLFWNAYTTLNEIARGIYIDAWGTLLDLVIVGVILVVFEIFRRRRELVARYLEEIDDFKKWDTVEARLRIAGNIRRLARLDKTDIDFSGIVLRNFSFMNEDIESLRNAKFSTGLRLDKISKNATELENVDFIHVDCSGVTFSNDFGGSAALGLVGKNLRFTAANLTDASFAGANLSWSIYEPDQSKWYENLGEDDEGRPMLNQIYYPAFAEADLTGCSFRYAKLDHADFRDADNILKADFREATGLETCFFDDEVRDRIIASALRKRAT